MASTGTLIFYIGAKLLSGAGTMIIMIIFTPVLLCLIYKRHRNECRVHYKSFILYVLGYIIYVGFAFTIEQYLLWVQISTTSDKENPDQCENGFMMIDGKCMRRKITHSNICWNIIGAQHLIVPLIVLYFKRNKDIFTSFSKLDEMAFATIFMEKTEMYGRSRTNSSNNSSRFQSIEENKRTLKLIISEQVNDQTESLIKNASLVKSLT